MSPDPPKLPADGHRPPATCDATFDAPTSVCSNCSAALHGPYCHACGQPAKTPVRHLPGLVEDALDTVFDFDGRVIHTLPALYARPGFLSREYFAGRRARYISPFRLMFLLCLMAFFVTRLEINYGARHIVVNPAASAQVSTQFDQQLADWRKAAKTDTAPASGSSVTTPASANSSAADTPFLGFSAALKRLDFRQHPIAVSGWPPVVNQAINTVAIRMYDNVAALSGDDPRARAAATDRIISQIFAVLPQTLLVLLPLFALLLKVVYLFKRRLYVEHLIVALHSHAFLFLSLLSLALLALAGHALGDHPGLRSARGWTAAAATWWVPIHLLIAQKRIYAQVWPMTVLKFAAVGSSYMVLVGLGLVFAVAIGFAAA